MQRMGVFVLVFVIHAQLINPAVLSFDAGSLKINLSVHLFNRKAYVNSDIHYFLIYTPSLSISVICQAIFHSANAWIAATRGLLEFFQVLKISWY